MSVSYPPGEPKSTASERRPRNPPAFLIIRLALWIVGILAFAAVLITAIVSCLPEGAGRTTALVFSALVGGMVALLPVLRAMFERREG